MPWAEGAFKDPMKSNFLKLFAYASVKTEHWPKYSQVHKYWDIDTILTFWLYTPPMDFKWNEQDVL